MDSKPLIPWTIGAGDGMGVVELDADQQPVQLHLYARSSIPGADAPMEFSVEDVLYEHGIDPRAVAVIQLDDIGNFYVTNPGQVAIDALVEWVEQHTDDLHHLPLGEEWDFA